MATRLKKENSEFKPVKLCLKIDFVLLPACAEGLGNVYKWLLLNTGNNVFIKRRLTLVLNNPPMTDMP